MSTPNNPIYASREIIDFYTEHLKDHGGSAKGVGWKNEQAQVVRFEELSRVFKAKENFYVNDLGCGTGEFFNFLLKHGFTRVSYQGYDILGEMVEAARKKIGHHKEVHVKKISAADDLMSADYSVASGVFNVKYEAADNEWLSYITATLQVLNDKSRLGFSVNFLSSYSDREHKQSYLYYADPLFLFDYCKKNFSKNVALLHDYDQYDFTLIVRKF